MSGLEQTGPGRPREFDVDAAVLDAIEVFRAHGYHGASVQELTRATGLARGSLYKAFHDKRSLFLTALDHYMAASLQRVGNDLAGGPSARESIQRALLGYARRAAGGAAKNGCLITGAAMELVPEDQEVAGMIARMFRRIQDLFAATVIRGQASGEIASTVDERAVAQFLLCTLQGLRVVAKIHPADDEIQNLVSTALRILD